MGPEVLKIAQKPSSAVRSAFTLVTENDVEREIAAKRIWRNADAVCFDVDSTVCQVSKQVIPTDSCFEFCFSE